MVSQLGKHGGFDLTVRAKGDLDVDAHHTVEDVGITVGEVLAEALGDKAGIRRFASIDLPLDEALVEVALDLSGRPYLTYDVGFAPDVIAPGHAARSTRSWPRNSGGPSSPPPGSPSTSACRTGKNTHHILEASFKGVARALRDAVRQEGGGSRRPRGRCDLPAAPTGWLPPGRLVIAVLDYGIGNLRSAEKALQHLGADARLVSRPG